MKRIIIYSLALLLTIIYSFGISTGVNAQIITMNDGTYVSLEQNDQIIFKEDIITDEDKLYSLAEYDNQRNDTISGTAIIKETKKQYNNSGEKNEFKFPMKTFVQHYMTVQHENGTTDKYYCANSVICIPKSILSNEGSSELKGWTAEHDACSIGVYDSTYSARAWAKIHYKTGTYSTNTDYNEIIRGIWYRGTVIRNDNTVSVSGRRIWFRNHGYRYTDRAFQNVTLGPYYAASGYDTITVNAPSSFYTLLKYPTLVYELTCTCLADISRGSSTWNVQASISVNSY